MTEALRMVVDPPCDAGVASYPPDPRERVLFVTPRLHTAMCLEKRFPSATVVYIWRRPLDLATLRSTLREQMRHSPAGGRVTLEAYIPPGSTEDVVANSTRLAVEAHGWLNTAYGLTARHNGQWDLDARLLLHVPRPSTDQTRSEGASDQTIIALHMLGWQLLETNATEDGVWSACVFTDR